MAQGPAGRGDRPGAEHSDPRIDAALDMVEGLDAVAVDRHPAVYAQVDDRLREALASPPEPGTVQGSERDQSSA